MKLIFLDTETTGVETKDRLCQVAYKIGDTIKNELFTPPLPIKIEAMAMHHITEKMIEGKPAFQKSQMHKDLVDVFAEDDTILIAHNAQYDAGMLEKEGVEPRKIICTLKVARYLDDKAIIPSYALQYLRYLLNIEIDATAHDAEGDVLVLEKLFERLKEKDISLEKMIEVSSKPSLIRKFNFGKHKGRKLEDVVKDDSGYLEWLLGQKEQKPEGQEDWIYSLKHYLNN